MQTNQEGGGEEDRSQVEKREPKALILGAEKKLEWSPNSDEEKTSSI